MKSPHSTSPGAKNRKIDVQFTGGKLTSDAGAVLLRQVDQALRLTERVNDIIADPRDPIFVTHIQRDLIAQRIFSIALGYENVNDHDSLRGDPALLAAIKNHTDRERLLADPVPFRKQNHRR